MTLSSHGFRVESRVINAEQLAKLRSFKQLLQHTGSWDDAIFDEHDCARFLKARNYDLQAAKQMWDSMLLWRRENRVDTIREWFDFHERPQYDAVFPTGLHKTDKEGHPILIQQLGRVNIGALYKVTTDDRIRLAHIAENEHLRQVVFPACSRAAGRPIDQLFTIIDLEGVAFTGMMRTTSLLKMFMAMDSNNYPETLAHMAIINAPGWFSTSWGAVKSVLSGDTVRKIEILGKDYQAALLRSIPRENLLVEYGGLSQGRITDNDGPWLEPIPEPPAPPAKQLQQPGACRQDITPTRPGAGASAGELSRSIAVTGEGDQRTPRDVSLACRSTSPVRPGALSGPKAAAGAVPLPGQGSGQGHPAPPVSPPLAKRAHCDESPLPAVSAQQQQLGRHPPPLPPHQQQLRQLQCSSSPAMSVSDASSEASQSMAAPLMSNFLPSSGESPQPNLGHGHGHSSRPPSSGSHRTGVALRRGSSAGGASGIMSGLVASLQAAVPQAGYHPHQHPQQQQSQSLNGNINSTPQGVVDGGVLHPPIATTPPGTTPSRGAAGMLQATPFSQHPHPQPYQQQQQSLPRGSVSAGSTGTGGVVVSRAAGVTPGQLQLVSPREDATGPGTLFSAISSAYSPYSAFSPMSPGDSLAAADTATSRPMDAAAGSGLGLGVSPSGAGAGAVGGVMGAGVVYLRKVSGGGPSLGQPSGLPTCFSGLPTGGSMYNSAVLASGDFPSGVLQQVSLQQPQHQQQCSQQLLQLPMQQDADDAESVRASVMSQRSFYSALSHLDPSSSSGLTSPNEASEKARRWSLQRELHAAAIASALAATAEQRRSAPLVPPPLAPNAGGKQLGTGTGGQIPPAAALAGVPCIVPPAAQLAFGSYLDQPPPYGSIRNMDGPFSSGAVGAAALASATDDCGNRLAGAAGSCKSSSGGATAAMDVQATADGAGRLRADGRGQASSQRTGDAVVHIVSEGGPGVGAAAGGMSRAPSAATIDDCSLGTGAVRWARGWFFRRRNYGRLVEDGAGDGAAGGNGVGSGRVNSAGGGAAGPGGDGSGRPPLSRKGSAAVAYASMLDGPGSTSPSKVLPKVPSAPHHSRGDSWEWDQPSPYDIDQTYGRAGMMQRDVSFGRGGERRRLLRSESPGRRQGLAAYCGCMPCCTVM